MSRAEEDMNVSDAPVDDLYERVETIFAELDELYTIMCLLTDRARIQNNDVQPNKRNHAAD